MNDDAGLKNTDPRALMHSVLQRIATGPELSKDLTRAETCAAMHAILDARVDPVQAGIFLIALRMKRETDDENLGVLDALAQATERVDVDVVELVDVADPYDGYTRGLPVSPFLPALLAACGVPALSHGVERVGPKYGATHRQVLAACGVPVDLSPRAAAARLADPAGGWAYVDQRAFCPRLHALIPLRDLIVKRPVITTVETLLMPLRARRKTHLYTGYVHKPYARVYAMLARASGFDAALIVRGVEGGVIPSLRQPGLAFRYDATDSEQAVDLNPADLDIAQEVRAVPLPTGLAVDEDAAEPAARVDAPAAARAAAALGVETLAGAPGPARDALVYGAALCLWHLGRHASLKEAARAARAALDSGAAARHLCA